MSEKKRLVELLLESGPIKERDLDDDWGNNEILDIAEHLLENGVIVPPVNVGDIVYKIVETYPKSYIKGTPVGVIVIKGTNDFSKELWEDVYGGVMGSFADIGELVFSTKEEALKALKGADK